MMYFPRFNPIEFRGQKAPYYGEDWDRYNPCYNNFICGVGDVLTFAVYIDILPPGNKFDVKIYNDETNALVDNTPIWTTNGVGFYAYNNYVWQNTGYYRVEVEYIDPYLGTFTYYSERVVCTDDLQYTRLLGWRKKGKWLGYDLDGLYFADQSFMFQKRLDISTYKSKSYQAQNTIFDNGWGKFAVVDSYPLTLLTLHIGYIYGLTDYTQEMCHLLRTMDYLELDGKVLQVTDDTDIELISADDHENRQGVTLSNLIRYESNYNHNILSLLETTPAPLAPPLLGNGFWLGDQIWYQGMIWKA